MNKTALRNAILDRLRAELQQQTDAANLARDEAISEESRPENKYDTHSQEAAYLAEGQARLAREIADNLAHYGTVPMPAFAPDAAIAIGALAKVKSAQGTTWYFIGPRAGGIEVQVDGLEVLVITPQSPLGRELLGKRAGAELRLPGRGAAAVVVSVQ